MNENIEVCLNDRVPVYYCPECKIQVMPDRFSDCEELRKATRKHVLPETIEVKCGTSCIDLEEHREQILKLLDPDDYIDRLRTELKSEAEKDFEREMDLVAAKMGEAASKKIGDLVADIRVNPDTTENIKNTINDIEKRLRGIRECDNFENFRRAYAGKPHCFYSEKHVCLVAADCERKYPHVWEEPRSPRR